MCDTFIISKPTWLMQYSKISQRVQLHLLEYFSQKKRLTKFQPFLGPYLICNILFILHKYILAFEKGAYFLHRLLPDIA